MRKTFYLLSILTIISFILIWNSCTEKPLNTSHEKDELTSLESRESSNIYGLRLPDGTQIIENNNSIYFSLPVGYNFVGTTFDNEMILAGEGTVSCDCTSGDGSCNPFETKKQVGCASDKKKLCKSCRMTTSSKKEGELYDFKNYFIKIEDSELFPMLGEGVVPITSLELWNQLDWVNNDLLIQYKNDIDAVLNFVNKEYNESTDTKVLVATSVGGRKMLLEIPYSTLEPGMMYTTNSIDGVSGGKCSGCKGNCKYKTGSFGQVRYCDGCDSGCTLSW